MKIKMDKINREIVKALQTDARQPIASVAKQAGISTSPCQKRMKQLEAQNVVTGYVANVDLSRICRSVSFLTEISLREQSQHAYRKFEDAIGREPMLVECFHITGKADYIARFVCPDVEEYRAVTRRLMENAPIKDMHSSVLLNRAKEFKGYPLDHLLEEGE